MGRETERRALDGLVAGARLGSSGVLLLVGEPGIGKTTLLDYVADRAGDMAVVRVAGAEVERDLPFGALALVLAPALDDLDELPAPQAAALRTALALDVGPPPDRFAVGAATLGMLTRRAERRPLALLLDDAHDLDRPSAEALVFAARRLLADRILLVAALREGEASPLRSADLPELALGGLNLTGTAELLLRSADSASGVSERRPGCIAPRAGTRWRSSRWRASRPGWRWLPAPSVAASLDSMRFRFPRRWPTGSSGARGRSRRRRRRCWPSSRRRRATSGWSSAVPSCSASTLIC